MARAAVRCTSIFTKTPISSVLPFRGVTASSVCSFMCNVKSLNVMPLVDKSSCRLPNHPHASTAIFTAGYFSSHNPTISPDPLVDKIQSAKTVDELFHLIGTRKAKLSENHISQAFFVLIALRQGAENQDKFADMVVSRPEFTSLCDLAENRVSSFEDVMLVNVLYCAFKLLKTPSHSLIRELRNEALVRVNSLHTPQLSKVAVCLADLGEKKGKAMGQLVEAVSNSLGKTKHLRELSTFMKECNVLMSNELKSRVLVKLRELVDPNCENIHDATASDFRKVFMSIDKFTDDYDSVLHKCTNFMWKYLEEVSTRELCVLLSCVDHLQYKNNYLANHLKDLLQSQLLSIKDPVDMALTTELLAFDAPAHVKFQLEANALRLVDDLPLGALGNLCTGLRRMGYISRTPLHDKLNDLTRFDSPELTLETLLPMVEYYTHLPWMTEETWDRLKQEIYKMTMEQINPANFLRGFYILSLIPTFRANEGIFKRAMCMLPQLHTTGTNSLFRAMKRIVEKSEKTGKVADVCLNAVNAAQDRAMKFLHKNTSPNFLIGLLTSILEEGGDMELVDALFKQLTSNINKIEPHHAVECARSLYKTRYLSKELMDRIVEVTMPNIHKVTPMQVLYLISPFCSLNYQPSNSDKFFKACTDRVIPFMENLPCGFLVDMAHLMSYNQLFPEEMLRHIFSLEFLTKLDEELEDLPDRAEMYRKRLMYLNRTVALECPELQVPWFHEEYCQDMLKNRNVFYHPDVQDVQKNLVEVLGGAQFLRSFVTTPYYYDITFECVLDENETLLPCADYGSVLTKGSGLSGTVLSDLMQWDTQRKQLPEGAQRVAIDYMFSSAYCVNTGHTLGMSIMKKRQLELLGYQYIQIPFFEWKSLALTERVEKEEYLRLKIFSLDQEYLHVSSSPIGMQHDDVNQGFIFAPFLLGKRRTVEDNLALRALQSYDRLS
ncbi:FAST kinase domain-containing protein 1, mitochondrial [Holothuria leucospilota]|uniref:FAST kinase domain-containing protein 1, mitochondrial n=1 Tax=Holothuria leucospilota TaxID=206669 RepID=A0A9Q1C1J0_HOLLE|nr:FAST kinase domain-containing protein 1, mitochondrial [Holothuria leucospilota]